MKQAKYLLLFVLISFVLPVYAQDGTTPSQEQATLFEADFESGYPSGISDFSTSWSVVDENPTNSMFCNQLNKEDWRSFQFGSESWDNYAISLRAKFLSDHPEHMAEIYFRINSGFEGYRATFWPDGEAIFSYGYPPYIQLNSVLINLQRDRWHQIEVRAYGDTFQMLVDDKFVMETSDDRRLNGFLGFGAASNTEACVDDIRVLQLDENGKLALAAPADVVTDEAVYAGCAFCFLDGQPAPAPRWDNERQGHVPNDDDEREQIVIDENFIVEAGEEVVFDNKIIWVRPTSRKDIEVRGTLIIQDSLLLWDQTEHQQTLLLVKDGGELRIIDSYVFWANQYFVNWNFEDGSTIYLDNFIGNPWTGLQGSVNYTAKQSTVMLTFLLGVQDSQVSITDAHLLWLELYTPTGTHEIAFPEKREWIDWVIDDLWPNTVLDIQNSYLWERDIAISNDTHITIVDTPSGFSLAWVIFKDTPGYIECELHGLGDPDNNNGVFYEAMKWDVPCNNSSLTVRDSVLQRAWMAIWGSVHLQIYDSNLVDPRNMGLGAIIEIHNSTIDHPATYNGGVVYLINSRIRYDIEVKDSDSVIYGYQISPRDENHEIEIIESDGGVYVELGMLRDMVAVNVTNLRACASTSCQIVGRVAAGDDVYVIGEAQGDLVSDSKLWYEVAVGSQIAYIHSSLLKET